jgi:Ca2+-binding EF-hand superfamily protein
MSSQSSTSRDDSSKEQAKNEPNSPEKQEQIMEEMLSKVEHPFSPSQIKELKSQFKMFDKMRDGRIPMKDMLSLMNTFIGLKVVQEELLDWINEHSPSLIDEQQKEATLANVRIDFGTFIRILGDRFIKDKNQKVVTNRDLFNKFDLSANGVVGRYELQHLFKNMLGVNLTEQEVTDMMKDTDVNSDGFMEFDEFEQLMNRLFSEEGGSVPSMKDKTPVK